MVTMDYRLELKLNYRYEKINRKTSHHLSYNYRWPVCHIYNKQQL